MICSSPTVKTLRRLREGGSARDDVCLAPRPWVRWSIRELGHNGFGRGMDGRAGSDTAQDSNDTGLQ